MRFTKSVSDNLMIKKISLRWVARDSNPHDINRYILSVLRLPFRHLPGILIITNNFFCLSVI